LCSRLASITVSSVRRLWLSLSCLVACAPSQRAAAPEPPEISASPVAAATAAASVSAAESPDAATAGSPPAQAPESETRRHATPLFCGDGCSAFKSVEAAFDHVLSRSPRVLAIGEAHAQKGTERIPSATRRFAESLLPRLRGRASDLVIEVVVAAGQCGKVEQRVAEKQRPVTQNQAPTAQNEFVSLAHRAKALGIRPRPLSPSCEEYDAIAAAGASDIQLMLETITRVTAREVSALLAAPSPSIVLTYGGALHNDVTPRAGAEAWSFGPELSQRATGAYIELDLIVPEYVKDTEVWRALPWYDAFARAPSSRATRLFTTGPQSYVLVFPNSS
jgi:hypothetical protein